MVHATRAAAGALGAALVASACTSVLGLDDLHYSPTATDGGLRDATAGDALASGDTGNDGAGGPFTVVPLPGTSAPGALAVDDANLYWVQARGLTNGDIRRAPKAGGAVTTLATGRTLPLDIAVDATTVYWSVSDAAPGTQYVCNAEFLAIAAPAGTAPTCVTNSQYATIRMTLDSTQVIFIARGTSAQYVGYAAKNAPLTPYVNQITGGTASAVAATDSNIYVSNKNGPHIDTFVIEQGSVQVGPRLCTNDCGVENPVDMVVDAANSTVFWATTDGNVYSASITAGIDTATNVGSIGTGVLPTRMAADASHVYLTAQQQGAVYAMRIAGGAVTTLASGENAPFGIALDGRRVYWTNADAIRATAVPP